jgi:DNA polymerase-1
MNNSVGSKPKIDTIRAVAQGLSKRIAKFDPDVIMTMGNVATTALLGNGPSIDKRRGFCSELNKKIILPSRDLFSIITNPDEFPDLVTDIKRALAISNGGRHTIDPPYHNYELIDSLQAFETLIKRLRGLQRRAVAVDIETTSLDPKAGRLLSLGLTWQRNTGCCVDCQWMDQDPDRTVLFKETLAGMKHIFHNAQFDVAWLRHRGFTINLEFDTMLAHYLLEGRQSGHGLKRLAADRYRAPAYDDKIDVKTLNAGSWMMLEEYRHEVMLYNCADTDYTFRLYEDLKKEMREDDIEWVHDNIMLPASIHFIRLKENGMQVNQEYHDKLGVKWLKEIEELEAQMKQFPGAEELNLRSIKQVKEYLYNTLALRPIGGRKNAPVSAKMVSREISAIQDKEAQEFWRTSNVSRDLKSSSTGTYMLYYLAQQHEFPRILVRHRILSKLRGTYYEGYKDLMDNEGKIRPSYKLHGTRTGRISSTAPNIHGMPRRKEIKSIFEADKGHVIISADYSQAEIRMVAHLAEDETLIKALDAQDIHKEISKTMFSMTDADVDALPAEEREIKRRAAKRGT